MLDTSNNCWQQFVQLFCNGNWHIINQIILQDLYPSNCNPRRLFKDYDVCKDIAIIIVILIILKKI